MWGLFRKTGTVISCDVGTYLVLMPKGGEVLADRNMDAIRKNNICTEILSDE